MEQKHDESQKDYRERLKDSALNLKSYLKGKILPGTESYGGRRKGRKMQYRGSEVTAETFRKRKAHRKRIKKIAYNSKIQNAFKRNKKPLNIKFCK